MRLKRWPRRLKRRLSNARLTRMVDESEEEHVSTASRRHVQRGRPCINCVAGKYSAATGTATNAQTPCASTASTALPAQNGPFRP
jgi:hypothetical protein